MEVLAVVMGHQRMIRRWRQWKWEAAAMMAAQAVVPFD